jgi:hypothetical protein
MVQPLLEAGLNVEEIRVLVFRLSFETVVGIDRGAPGDLMTLVDDQPAEVRAAWAETIDRMVTAGPTEPGADRVG